MKLIGQYRVYIDFSVLVRAPFILHVGSSVIWRLLKSRALVSSFEKLATKHLIFDYMPYNRGTYVRATCNPA